MLKALVVSIILIQTCLALKNLDLLSEDICKNVDLLRVHFGGGSLQCGDELDYKSLNSGPKPWFHFKDAKKRELYTIIIVDVDTPGCKTKLQYIISNIKGEELAKRDITEKDVFAVYNAPYFQPPPEMHRYYIYAFLQEMVLADLYFDDRCGFNLDHFVEGNSLKLVAANMFKTQNKSNS